MPQQGSRSASSAGRGTMFASHTASALRKQSAAEQNRRTGTLRGKGRGGACTDSTCVQRSPVTAGIAHVYRYVCRCVCVFVCVCVYICLCVCMLDLRNRQVYMYV